MFYREENNPFTEKLNNCEEHFLLLFSQGLVANVTSLNFIQVCVLATFFVLFLTNTLMGVSRGKIEVITQLASNLFKVNT